MFRFLSGTILILMCAFLLSCQTYTTGLQQSVARADETSAIGAMKAIATAQQMYSISNGGAYASFQQLCDVGMLDARFNAANPEVNDYVFTMEAGSNSYKINADPAGSGEKGGRHLYMDSSGPLVHVNATQPATAKDPLMKL